MVCAIKNEAGTSGVGGEKILYIERKYYPKKKIECEIAYTKSKNVQRKRKKDSERLEVKQLRRSFNKNITDRTYK